MRALSIYAGAEAAAQLAREGWSPDLFSLLLGASGGPKWFVLAQLDRLLFGEFLAAGSRPLSTLGSSIGAWRHACLAQDDPAAAVGRLEQGYIHQRYSSAKPDADEVSEVARGILAAVLGTAGAAAVAGHPRIRSHIVTARGRGPSASTSTPWLGAGMGAAALGNVLHRRLLQGLFQRVVFHSGEAPQAHFALEDFATCYSPLSGDNTLRALHASGAIPFVLAGERDIPGAPPGQYWDGGIIDYHFDLAGYRGDGLVLFPHFSPTVIPGWFDKFAPWRRIALGRISRLVLLCPTAEFVATLPGGKIPDRSDFQRLGAQERVRAWETCVARSRALAEEFSALLAGPDPLAGVTVLA